MQIYLASSNPKDQDEIIADITAYDPAMEYPVGVECTLDFILPYLRCNIDGQHFPDGTGQAAIEIALEGLIMPHNTTFVVNRPDVDALGAIAIQQYRYDTLGDPDAITDGIRERVAFVAKEDKFVKGPWSEHSPQTLLNITEFPALSAVAFDRNLSIEDRLWEIKTWIITGKSEAVSAAYERVLEERKECLATSKVDVQENIAIVKSVFPSALALGYCYAPVVVAINSTFMIPGVAGSEPHTKITIAQYENTYVYMGAIREALNAHEKGPRLWGPANPTGILGSPIGQDPAAKLEEVVATVWRYQQQPLPAPQAD